LPLGPPMGPAGDAATRNIHDFVIDYHNAAFFILAQSNEIPTVTGNGNGYLYRIECDGTFSALTPQGNPNPLRLILNEAFQNNGTADITIDQHNAAGGLLGSAADVQMVVVSHTGFGNTEPDLRILSSELTWNPSAALDFQDGSISDPAYAPGTATMDPLTNRLVVQPENCDACYHWYNAPPGWQ
ncbi:MAG TPA: hypothetical protein VEI97_19905, partial [bacterium]|nr:hypothetical protein [bacterium]